MNAYNVSTSDAIKISDQLFETVKQGKTNIPQLASSIGQIAPLASQAGVATEELFSAIAVLTKQGVSTAESMTLIKGVLSSVIQPGDSAKKAIKDLGLELFNLEGIRKKGIIGLLGEMKKIGLLGEMKKKTGGIVPEIAKLIPNIRGLSGAMGLTGIKFDEFGQILDDTRNKSGQTEEAFGKMADSMGHKITLLENGISEASTAFTEGIILGITDGLGGTQDLTEAMREFAKAATQAGKAVGFIAEKAVESRDLFLAMSGFDLKFGLIGFDLKFGLIGRAFEPGEGEKAETSERERQIQLVKDLKAEIKSLGELSKEAKDTMFGANVELNFGSQLEGIAGLYATIDQIQADTLAKKQQQIALVASEREEAKDRLAINRTIADMEKQVDKMSAKRLAEEKKITEEKNKQRDGMSQELNLMSDIKRAQTLQLGKFLSTAGKEDILNLNQFQREAIKSNSFLKETFRETSERTGLTDETSKQLNGIMVQAANTFSATLVKTAEGKAVNSVEEAGTIVSLEDQLAGVIGD